MRRRSAVVAIMLGLAAAVAPASAGALTPPPPTEESLPPQGITEDGWPRLSTGRPGRTTWYACTPTAGCGQAVGEGPSYVPGPTEPGTTFSASTTDGATLHRARSRPWTGRVTSVEPPAMTGDLRIGRPLTPVPGVWSGGFGTESSLVGLRACPSPAGVDCRALSAAGLQPGGGPVMLDPAYAGWWVGAFEQRIGADTAFPAIGLLFPFGEVSGHRPPPAARLVAFGPLAGPVPAARPGAPPSVGGTLAVGRRVTPRAGTWPDAPGDGRIATAVRVCPTRRDTARCVLLNDLVRLGPSPSGLAAPSAPVVLDERHLGWYAGAVDRHSRADVGEFPRAVGRPEVVPPPGPTIVRGPLSAVPIRLGFTPRASIPRRVAARPSTLRLATIRCAGPCLARVTLKARGRTVARRVAADEGDPGTLRVRHARLGRASRVRVVVRFDDHPAVARRTVRVG